MKRRQYQNGRSQQQKSTKMQQYSLYLISTNGAWLVGEAAYEWEFKNTFRDLEK